MDSAEESSGNGSIASLAHAVMRAGPALNRCERLPTTRASHEPNHAHGAVALKVAVIVRSSTVWATTP